MILAGALFLGFFTLFMVTIKPRIGILILIVVKPIIDATWDHGMLGVNALRVVGAGIPLIIILRFMVTNDLKERGMPMALLWMSYVFVNFISFGMIIISGKLIGSIDFILRILNGFVGFYMFQVYFPDKIWFRRLLIAFILAGFFPMLMGVYQAATGQIWQMRKAVGLVRNVGVYHDAFSFRSYAYMTITAILLYWSYFTERSPLKKLLLIGYGLICSVVIFKIYSKAGYVVYAIWTTIWTLLNKKIISLIVIVVAVLGFNFAMGNKIFDDISTTFLKETSAIEGTSDSKYILGGRMTVWEDYWIKYKNADAFGKIFGLGVSAGSAHNDYLRVLVGGGIVGLFIYVMLLCVIGLRVLGNLISDFSPFSIMAFMIFMMWMMDTIGLSPGLYPAYQWYVWGFIGLSLRGVEGLSEAEVEPIRDPLNNYVYDR